MIPDVVAPGLAVLFCGINPGLYSDAPGQHFARPGNRFWPVLHRAGFTPRQLRPAEQEQLPALGLGITNLVARATARADELSSHELHDGAARLARLVEANAPRFVAVVGISAYRSAFDRPKARIGEQAERLGTARAVGAAEPEWPERALPVAGPHGGVPCAPPRAAVIRTGRSSGRAVT